MVVTGSRRRETSEVRQDKRRLQGRLPDLGRGSRGCPTATEPLQVPTLPLHVTAICPKAPFGPHQSSGSAHSPPSSQPLLMLVSPLSPGHGTPRGEGEGTVMAAGSEVEIIGLLVLAKHICPRPLWPRLFALEALHRTG